MHWRLASVSFAPPPSLLPPVSVEDSGASLLDAVVFLVANLDIGYGPNVKREETNAFSPSPGGEGLLLRPASFFFATPPFGFLPAFPRPICFCPENARFFSSFRVSRAPRRRREGRPSPPVAPLVTAQKGSSTGSLIGHLEQVRDLRSGAASAGGDPSSSAKRQRLLFENPLVPEANNLDVSEREAIEDICVLWAQHALSYRLVDSPLYRKVFGSCIPQCVNRNSLPKYMIELATQLEGEMRGKCEGEGATLTFDTWTQCGDKWANVSAIAKVSIRKKCFC